MDERSPMFEKNEIVKAYHYLFALMQQQRGQLYDAIITEIKRGSGEDYKYKVHYKGWNKRLDEFLPLEKITKIDSECISKPAEQSETAEEKKRGRDIYEETVEESVILVEETIDSVSKTVKKRGPKKKRLETYAEVLLTLPEKEAHKNNNLFEFKLFIPVELEEILIDQETIFLAPSFKGPLPQLPWQSNLPTVARILENFSNRQEDQPVAQYSHISELLPDPTRSHPPHSVIKETMAMLAEHFDRMLPAMLLYSVEWGQYETMCKGGSLQTSSSGDGPETDGRVGGDHHTRPVDVYGAEHLLRMLYLLPNLLSVPACSSGVTDEKAYMLDVETALQEYTIIFNGIISYIADERDQMLPQMHSLVSSDSAVEAIRAAARERPVHTIEEAALHCQLPGAEESRLDDRSMVVNCPHPEHEAVGVIGISEDISTMAKISTSQSGYDARVGPREHEEGDPEVEENGGTDPDNGDSERDEESWTAMLIDIDTPDDLKHADVIDEQRRQLAEIENQKKIADCPKSWTCLKCSVLNAHRSRSCDSCADKKPPPVLVPRVKFPGPGRPRDMSKTSQPTVKKSHKKKESTSSPEEQLVRVSKPQMGGPLMTLDVKTEKMTAAGKEDGLIIQPIKKSHKKKVVLSVPAEITAGTLPVREGTVSTATA